VAPGDVLVGGLLAASVAFVLRPRGAPAESGPLSVRAAAFAAIFVSTLAEMARGSLRTVRFCLGPVDRSGIVEIPRGERSRHSIALWGVLTGESPDEVPVDVDDDRDVLIVHIVDAGDPEGVRERHRREYERRQRKVVP
jgi:multisubunit Na+/H+ antiporter MnhE subunit